MIGPYRLERVLGTGSFATVWLAHDDVLERAVAVKILADNWSRDEEVRRRFLSEARVLLTAESPRIVRGFHLGEAATGQPYLVMAWADRGTLGDRLDQRRQEGRTFAPDEVVGIATEVAFALTDVHASGHLHRDVKPTNVLIRSSSTRRNIAGLASDETIVLGDFGLARGLDLSALTLVAGSPGYVAPEQAAGLTQLDRRADLYSLGRIMLELLTGDPGGRATTMAGAASERIDVAKVMDAMRERGASEPAPALVELITRLVDENPDNRPSSAEEVSAELAALAGSATANGSGGRRRPLAPPSAPPQHAPAGPGGERPLTGTQLGAPAPRARSFSLTDKRALSAVAVLVVAIAGVILALTVGGDDPEGGGSTTVAATSRRAGSDPVGSAAVAPATSDDAATTDAPDTTATTGSTDPPGSAQPAAESTAPEPTATATASAPATAGPDSTGPGDSAAPESTVFGQLAGQMALPDRVVIEGAFEGRLDPDRQTGYTEMSPVEFAQELRKTNADWTGDESEADADGGLDFELVGPARTARVRVVNEPNTAYDDGEVTRYVIDYE